MDEAENRAEAAKATATAAEEDLEETGHQTDSKMKIAVSIEKPEDSSELSEVFGRSKYFLIYDSVNNAEEILYNPFASELGGSGIQSARLLIEKNVEIVITKKIGLNPLRFLNSANIKVYQCTKGTASEAIQLFKEEKLSAIEIGNKNIHTGRKRKRCGRRFSDKKFPNNYSNNR